MCLILAAEERHTVPKNFFEHVANKNGDGVGFMWIQNNKLHTWKELYPKKHMDKVHAKYLEIKEFSPYIHFRMRTHGDIDEHNCHPYYCGFGIYMMHNGVISIKQHDKSKSDTWHFVNDIINPILKESKNPHRLIRSEAFAVLLSDFVGASSRLVFGDRGGFALINGDNWVEIEEEGTGCKGMLVSNSYAWSESHFKPTRFSATPVVIDYLSSAGKGYPSPYAVFNPNASWVPDKFASEFELIEHPHYYDSNFNIWERTASGFKRCWDLDISDMEEVMKKAEANREASAKVANSCEVVSTTITLPVITKEEPDTNKEDENEYQGVLPLEETEHSGWEKEYEKNLVKQWSKLSPEERENLVYTDPMETASVLERIFQGERWN